jgi:hypothetical protein
MRGSLHAHSLLWTTLQLDKITSFLQDEIVMDHIAKVIDSIVQAYIPDIHEVQSRATHSGPAFAAAAGITPVPLPTDPPSKSQRLTGHQKAAQSAHQNFVEEIIMSKDSTTKEVEACAVPLSHLETILEDDMEVDADGCAQNGAVSDVQDPLQSDLDGESSVSVSQRRDESPCSSSASSNSSDVASDLELSGGGDDDGLDVAMPVAPPQDDSTVVNVPPLQDYYPPCSAYEKQEQFREHWRATAITRMLHATHSFTCHKGIAGKKKCRMGYPKIFRNRRYRPWIILRVSITSMCVLIPAVCGDIDDTRCRGDGEGPEAVCGDIDDTRCWGGT